MSNLFDEIETSGNLEEIYNNSKIIVDKCNKLWKENAKDFDLDPDNLPFSKVLNKNSKWLNNLKQAINEIVKGTFIVNFIMDDTKLHNKNDRNIIVSNNSIWDCIAHQCNRYTKARLNQELIGVWPQKRLTLMDFLHEDNKFQNNHCRSLFWFWLKSDDKFSKLQKVYKYKQTPEELLLKAKDHDTWKQEILPKLEKSGHYYIDAIGNIVENH